jgi:hypothetical protein
MILLILFSALMMASINGSKIEKDPVKMNLPNLTAVAENKDIIVTIESFWNEPEWKDYELSNLTVFYKFDVNDSVLCDDIVGTIVTSPSNSTIYCFNNLAISIDSHDDDDYKDINNDDSIDDIYDDLPSSSEIEFGRDVFANANFVEFWYTVNTKNKSQLFYVKNTVKSNILKYDLKNNISNSPTKAFDTEELLAKWFTTKPKPKIFATPPTKDMPSKDAPCDCILSRKNLNLFGIVSIFAISIFGIYFVCCHIRKNSTKKVVNGKEYYFNTKL